MTKAAVLVGVDHYLAAGNLSGCVNDALALERLLHRNSDGSLNFETKPVTSTLTGPVRAGKIREEANALFSNRDVDVALFYFAGHGALERGLGYLCSSDSSSDNPGVAFQEILAWANASPARHRFIILDCCHSGAIRDMVVAAAAAPLNEGVAVLAACRDDQLAKERGERGLFTSHICDALDGGAADVQGTVTIAGLYAYVDAVLSAFAQRPLIMASLSTFVALRRAEASLTDAKLRKLPELFPALDAEYRLDPSYEPTEESRTDAHVEIFSLLQQFRAARLVVPVGEEHMYFAAMNRKSCKLTPLGRFYWHKAAERKI